MQGRPFTSLYVKLWFSMSLSLSPGGMCRAAWRHFGCHNWAVGGWGWEGERWLASSR